MRSPKLNAFFRTLFEMVEYFDGPEQTKKHSASDIYFCSHVSVVIIVNIVDEAKQNAALLLFRFLLFEVLFENKKHPVTCRLTC